MYLDTEYIYYTLNYGKQLFFNVKVFASNKQYSIIISISKIIAFIMDLPHFSNLSHNLEDPNDQQKVRHRSMYLVENTIRTCVV